MDIDYLVKNYLQNYDQLIEQLAYLMTEESQKETLLVLNGKSKDKKWADGVNFSMLIKDESLDLFLKNKSKLFLNEEISESLFGNEITLKKIFHNRDDNVKFVLWSYLHLMVLMVELAQKKKNKDKIKKITKVVESNVSELEKCKKKVETFNKTTGRDPKTMIKDMLGVEVNDQTNDMVADIVKSFEGTLGAGGGGAGANPLAGILDISKKISEKYQDKINKGDIQLDKLMEGIQKTIPGMDQMMKGGGMEGMMSSMMGGAGGAGGAGGLGSMMGSMFGKEAKKETVIIDENFSTSNVDVGQIKEGMNINIGKMLNMANSMGVIPGGKEKEGNPAGPNIMELFGMMNGIDKIKTKEEADALKTKVDSFIENKLGLDMSKISKDMEKMFKQEPKKEEEEEEEDEEEESDDNNKEETNKELDELMKGKNLDMD
jgi:hypothetical protein